MFNFKSGIITTILLSAFVLAGCDENKKPAETEKVLHVGTFGVSIGFSYKQNGKDYEGYDIATVNAVAKKLGYSRVELTTADMTGLFGMLDAGKIDTIANQVEVNDKRREKYQFSQPYIYSGAQLVTRNNDDSIQNIADLKGKRLGVDVGSSKENFLRKNYPDAGIDIHTYDEPSAIIQDVALGRIDAYIMDRAGAQLLIDNSRLPLKKSGEPVYRYQEAFPFVKNEKGDALRKEFDDALTALKADGTLTKLSGQYLKQDVSKE
ncbi:transporter substrate-binding domain-containing protein [Klebsiella quasipneumoniae]|uniref:transporter substrate-binding domain-containing protein n=1 Tax=Klebsiella quasipneumoniae TaxID=1463165 RepID=UPI001646F081|nr:transporter substrate-binding domain-containing protein [Klebsiella quasipneumoniae]HCT5903736.1 transporter substrate-binding domain-containing protein [Klebsiella pneumoniae]MBC4290439.1 transporter substrate-binding domain-containing protein [Klebsiella quasipneumoniae]HDK9881721.1 transporter substrate-binding domain-containing protein [Klebsiella pneumoniae]HDK9892439.1 transporter substrate-binding domain-containing protein [Klebsiella pneumoniae]HDK9975548.1 transporter substrate-bin